MKILEIKSIQKDDEQSHTVWFSVDDYPDSVFGLKYHPNAEFKKHYIISASNTEYWDEVDKIKKIEEYLDELKNDISKLINNKLSKNLLEKWDSFD